jgi:hypothetical protein
MHRVALALNLLERQGRPAESQREIVSCSAKGVIHPWFIELQALVVGFRSR